MYSQNNEEQIILDYFKDKPKGILLDIGANDGVTFSNSLALIDFGWKALLVEPSPVCVDKLRHLHAGNKNVLIAPFAIVTFPLAKDSQIVFHESGSLISDKDYALVSTVVEKEKERFPDVKYSTVLVDAVCYSELLEMLGCPETFDFISIDAEGLDFDILTQMNLSNTQMVCVEYNGIDPEKYIAYCAGFGLKEIHRNGENLIFAR